MKLRQEILIVFEMFLTFALLTLSLPGYLLCSAFFTVEDLTDLPVYLYLDALRGGVKQTKDLRLILLLGICIWLCFVGLITRWFI